MKAERIKNKMHNSPNQIHRLELEVIEILNS